MSQVQSNSLLEYIRGLVSTRDADGSSDRALLQRFASRQDEIAFKAILRRHGPMVLRVSQRWLKRGEDIEDVFQATFLVLARKAGTLKWSESVGNWLYGVAHRLALEARRKQLGRQVRESRALAQGANTPRSDSGGDPLAEVTGRELIGILDEELANLPGRLRAPLLLHLEGKRDDEAAQHLGCSLSTFKRGLRRARELLEGRLKRRGFALSTAVTALLVYNTASATVPLTLLNNTAQAAFLLASGKSLTAGLVSAEAVALASGLTHALLVTKLKIAAAAAVLVSAALAGAWTLARSAVREEPASAKASILDDERKLDKRLAPVAATIETTLASAPGQIRQFAFDGDSNTFFASARNATRADHFTLVLDQPVLVRSLAVLTGRPNGADSLNAGMLEGSENGRDFEPLARFANGIAQVVEVRRLRAVRVRPEGNRPLTIREFTINSEPPVAVFRYPVEFVIDVNDAPEMKVWAEKTARICERFYPMIQDEFKNDDPNVIGRELATNRSSLIAHHSSLKAAHVITMALKNDYGGLVEVENDRIIGSVKYFRDHQDDVGAMIFMTSCSVQGRGEESSRLARVTPEFVQRLRDSLRSMQRIRGEQNPLSGFLKPLDVFLTYLTRDDRAHLWLALGIADYVRFFKYEPGKLPPLDPDKMQYNANSRATAAFLAFLVQKYDNGIVRKLNQIVRAGEYKDEVFKELTGKTLPQLNEEWRSSLRPMGKS
jgi:RNA polymerase sigma factor (sigma-70 family)